MDIVLMVVRLLLATIFVGSGTAKLVDRAGARQAMLDFGVPALLAPPFAVLLPVVELAVAGSLVPTVSAWAGALAAFGLLLLFTVAVGYQLVRGRTPPCHCFGSASAEPIGWPTLVRNLVLIALAGVVVGSGRTDAGVSVLGWLGTMTDRQRVELGGGVLAIALLAVQGVVLIRLLRAQGRLAARVADLEMADLEMKAGGPRTTADTPYPAVAVGRAPTFRLPDLAGSLVTLDALLAPGLPVLLIFSDPECGPCGLLLPEVGRWQHDHAGTLTLALISRGTPEANQAKTNPHGIAPVLLQQDRETADAYQAPGTPCASLVYPDGTVRSSPACGPERIRELVEQAAGMDSRTLPMAGTRKNAAAAAPTAATHGRRWGETAPAFTLPGLSGHPVSLGDFRGTEVLLLFWNPGCGFCREILDELKDWDAALPHDGPTLLVISTGDDDENRALGLRSPVLRDEGFTVGPTFGAHGTPMAVQVTANGTITSDVTSGAPDVRSLLRSLLRSNQAPAKPISPAYRKAATTSSINGHSTRHHGR
ncbi:MauE/DoxX family redox-associated membrane protein [Frankia sp. Cas3]|uniref:MauE/DoxX family redox-associated membrane protein n=1 Tax=Frankia sp. Cas3 TaxID=3073926 RepID=UPI002AD3F91E|nr:MauE/DoxX family redox-associated membrane protein [Frankia sp. Cas3]